MGYTSSSEIEEKTIVDEVAEPPKQRYVLHAVLFVATFLSCLIAGIQWHGGADLSIESNWTSGLSYAALIMLFISAHEFGHFFAARYHGVDATLPYYIPMPLVSIMPFGTMGAVIRTRSPIMSRKVLFDIGVAGPLAGFVVCLVVLIIGFMTLPDVQYLYEVHPEYLTLYGGHIPEFGLRFGDTILFSFLAKVFANPQGFMPPMNEVYHYPFLCVGWFGMFVTSLNLLPIGQLDGGHVLYAMFGRRQGFIARIVVTLLVIVGVLGLFGELTTYLYTDSPDELFMFFQSIFVTPLDWLQQNAGWTLSGWSGWLFWAALARFFFRFDHPPLVDTEPLDRKRMIIGYAAMAIFVMTLSLNGIMERSPDAGSGGIVPNKTVVESTQGVINIPASRIHVTLHEDQRRKLQAQFQKIECKETENALSDQPLTNSMTTKNQQTMELLRDPS